MEVKERRKDTENEVKEEERILDREEKKIEGKNETGEEEGKES